MLLDAGRLARIGREREGGRRQATHIQKVKPCNHCPGGCSARFSSVQGGAGG
jgi:hypothetical protein